MRHWNTYVINVGINSRWKCFSFVKAFFIWVTSQYHNNQLNECTPERICPLKGCYGAIGFFFPVFFYHIKVLCWYFFNFPKIFSFFFFQYLFAYLAVPGLSCGRYVVSWPGIRPDQGSDPGPLHWERGVLATGPPGKSHLKFSSYYT